jgi:hypothetical protein
MKKGIFVTTVLVLSSIVLNSECYTFHFTNNTKETLIIKGINLDNVHDRYVDTQVYPGETIQWSTQSGSFYPNLAFQIQDEGRATLHTTTPELKGDAHIILHKEGDKIKATLKN